MFKFFRRLFTKKKPKKVIELFEEIDTSRKRRHDFSSFKDNKYCTILERIDNSKEGGTIQLKIAWRCPDRVKTGDTFVLNIGDGTRTLRIVEILKEDSDVKLGMAVSFR